ncbi:MAG: 5-methylcytosine-specific restriction endonuclease system specificity protein McrC, partial [Muribaculum sp.]|nr:5-methylcytosine-specific restriction endonuclease system specificity protein McrC [Muribaculum sp.]
YYKKHHPEFKACAKQIAWNVIEEETSMSMLPILQTDIYLTGKERTLIIDTKYYSKSSQVYFDKHTIHSHNQNQILTYILNHDREHKGKTDGMLLYAKTQEEIQPNGQMKWHDGNMIYYRNLDLNQDFNGIKAQLDNLIKPSLLQ